MDGFEHYAFYNPNLGRIEMHLVGRGHQRIRVEDRWFDLQAGETIHTENSYKFTVDEFGELAAVAGFRQHRVWTDDQEFFSVQLLRTL
jgi:uncharacterized SAM-dependent methyltransferase